MKKLSLVLVLVACLLVVPKVNAAESSQSGTPYGTITVDETPWSSDNPVVTQVYYITESSQYVAMKVIPVLNVANVEIIESSSAFEIIDEIQNSDGSVTVVLKATNGSGVNGTKTELFTAVADFTGAGSEDDCNLSYSPITLSCTIIGDTYFGTDGEVISEDEYAQLCGNIDDTPNDEDIPNTGSAIPYIAVGGGLLAIAGVYLYSRKSNKVYKI